MEKQYRQASIPFQILIGIRRTIQKYLDFWVNLNGILIVLSNAQNEIILEISFKWRKLITQNFN